jgi:anti-sigma factor RsiW
MSSSVLPSECAQARESVSARLDGELSEFDSVRLSAHLRQCPACSSHARELESIANALRAAAVERPVEMWLPRRRFAGASRMLPLGAAAAVAVAAALSFVAGHYYAASSSSRATTVTATARVSPRADVVERQVLAMLRDRSTRKPTAGTMIFV